MKVLSTFLMSIIAGIFISLGSIAYLSVDNKFIGSLLFCTGLLMILSNGYMLFTSKVGYLFRHKLNYIIYLIIVYLGNFVGTQVSALGIRLSRLTIPVEHVESIANAKLNDNFLSLFILGIFCNILVVTASEQYVNCKGDLGKYFGVIFCISAFIVGGYEHCIANMFYFGLANVWSVKAIEVLFVVTIGNIVGGTLVIELKKYVPIAKEYLDSFE